MSEHLQRENAALRRRVKEQRKQLRAHQKLREAYLRGWVERASYQQLLDAAKKTADERKAAWMAGRYLMDGTP